VQVVSGTRESPPTSRTPCAGQIGSTNGVRGSGVDHVTDARALVHTARMARYLALLRGINVGGKNLIKMAALAECFAAAGYADVVTYIQSGNVVFSTKTAAGGLVAQLERILGKTFGYQASVVVRTHRQLQAVVDGAPTGFGTQPTKYRYDVLFLKDPLTASAALEQVKTKPGVDAATAGPGALYFSRLVAKATQSQLSRLVSMPIYQHMTIRNWNTTTALLRLMDE
jgi:uncharacterized protein (DUF1697 family)